MRGRLFASFAAGAALVGAVAVGCGGSDGSSSSAIGETLTAAQVVDGLIAAGLPLGAVQVYDASNDPNENLGRPGQYTSKASFADTRIGTEVDGVKGGGDVEAFDDPTAQSSRADYLKAFADTPVIGGWYQYTAGNAILRVPFELTPDQAEQYNDALQSLFQ